MNNIIYQAFCAEWTGQLMKAQMNNGKVYTFAKPVRQVKGQFYVLAYNQKTSECRRLVVVPPGYRNDGDEAVPE